MRLRYMELPTECLAEVASTPFLLIVDRCSGSEYEHMSKIGKKFKKRTGARGVLVHPGEVHLADEEPTEAHDSPPAAKPTQSEIKLRLNAHGLGVHQLVINGEDLSWQVGQVRLDVRGGDGGSVWVEFRRPAVEITGSADAEDADA